MNLLLLPLSALKANAAWAFTDRAADFAKLHRVAPHESSTVAQWWAVVPNLAERLWVVGNVLQRIYPERKDLIVSALYEIGVLCADAALPIWEAAIPNDDRPRKALDAAREHLAGRMTYAQAVTVSDEARRAAKGHAASIERAHAYYAGEAISSVLSAHHAAHIATNAGADLSAAYMRLAKLIDDMETL